MRLSPLVEESWPDKTMRFGLAIQLTNIARRQFHAIALYKVNDRLMIGDLQSHLSTRRAIAEPNADVKWIAPDLGDYDQRLLAAKIDAWLELNENKIPYSVAHDPGGVVWKDNVWVGNEPGQGLTCATFILELFRELGLPFIDVNDWLGRDDDGEWAAGILHALSNQMSAEHVEVQRGRIGSAIRVRPSDIASAAHLIKADAEVSLKFAEIAPLSATIESTLLAQSMGSLAENVA